MKGEFNIEKGALFDYIFGNTITQCRRGDLRLDINRYLASPILPDINSKTNIATSKYLLT